VKPVQGFEREAPGGAGGDVEQEGGAVPTLVLLGVDVERDAADLAEREIVGGR
jgi:hypothetical protein